MPVIRKEGDYNLEKGMSIDPNAHIPNLLSLILKAQSVVDTAAEANYFDSGTKMVFYQSETPTGWTIDLTNMNKTMLNVRNDGSASPSWSGSIGGTHDIDSPPSTLHEHGNSGNTSLGSSTTFSHRHQLAGEDVPSGFFWGGYITTGDHATNTSNRSVNNAGGSASHAHTTSSGEFGDISPDPFTTEPPGPQFLPKYIECIIAIKD